MAIFAGGTPIGAPIVGLVANELGPRWALLIGAASGLVAATITGLWLLRNRRRVRRGTNPELDRELATQEIAIVGATAQRTS
jgi:MFS family permease